MTALRKHLQSIALIARTPSLLYRVRQYFHLDNDHLFVALRRARLGQADVVLCLLRIGTSIARRIAEALIGKPITIGPACLLHWRVNGGSPTVARQPIVTWVMPSPPLRKSTRLGACFAEFRVGRTREQLLMRGVSRGDMGRALRRGWIHMAGAA